MTALSAVQKRPPGPAETLRLGIDAETLHLLTSLHREYGDTVAINQHNGRLAYFVNAPEDVRRILVKHHARYRKGPGFERVKMLLGNGLIVSDGDIWRRSRRMIQPAFSRQRIHELVKIMVQCAERVADRFSAAAERSAPINITSEMNEFALELILISIFGADYHALLADRDDNPFAFLSSDSARDLGVVLKARQLREVMLEIIRSRRSRKPPDDFDFLAMYILARDKHGVAFSDKELLDELMTLIIAGFETSANTLNWVWYELARRPSVESELLQEIERKIPSKNALTAENCMALSYVQQVLEETLRMYPPVWLFTRRACRDDAIDGFEIPGGTDIYLSPFILHRSGAHWPEPETFDPQRFAHSIKDRPYFPFSLGPRRCLGEYFSLLEMKVHLATLLPRFYVEQLGTREPGFDLGINLRAASDIWLTPRFRA